MSSSALTQDVHRQLVAMGFDSEMSQKAVAAVQPKKPTDIDLCIEHISQQLQEPEDTHAVITRTLVGMGFDERGARKAAREASGDVHRAVLILLSKRSQRLMEAIADEEEELQRINATPGGVTTDDGDDVKVPPPMEMNVSAPAPSPLAGLDFGLAKLVKKEQQEVQRLQSQLMELQRKYDQLKLSVDQQRMKRGRSPRRRKKLNNSRSPKRVTIGQNSSKPSSSSSPKKKGVRWEDNLRS